MTKGEKIKNYRLLCNLTLKEVVDLGEFDKSVQWISQCENDRNNFSAEIEKSIYDAISKARARKLATNLK